ncbi:hypothetical protein Pelo_7182 [Pelomyxa schiedti]|nr:hypothetical protein Pelo_7182 [Pelomyxa schiedti]
MNEGDGSCASGTDVGGLLTPEAPLSPSHNNCSDGGLLLSNPDGTWTPSPPGVVPAYIPSNSNDNQKAAAPTGELNLVNASENLNESVSDEGNGLLGFVASKKAGTLEALVRYSSHLADDIESSTKNILKEIEKVDVLQAEINKFFFETRRRLVHSALEHQDRSFQHLQCLNMAQLSVKQRLLFPNDRIISILKAAVSQISVHYGSWFPCPNTHSK